MMQRKLQDDLLRDFGEQKRTLVEQIELFDPLATSLRRPAAQRLISKGILLTVEILCYLLCLGTVGFTVAMNMLFPFTALQNLRFNTSINDFARLTEQEYLSLAVHGMAALIALLLFILAGIARSTRFKNDILDLAGKNIKRLVEQHLRRKASIDAIAQRHFLELPGLEESANVNTVLNPGYDPVERDY